MNAEVTVSLSLVIVLFVNAVYCPGYYRPGAGINRAETQENLQELPLSYPLLSCESNSSFPVLHSSSSTYKFECSEETPSVCRLVERSSSLTNSYPFDRAGIEFKSMMEQEMTLALHVFSGIAWSVTCYFPSATPAQQFYKLITRDRDPESVPFVRAEYLKNSDNAVLLVHPNLYRRDEGNNMTIMVNNDVGDVVFLFQKDAVSEIAQYEPAKINLFIISPNPRRRMLYKFDFSTPSQAETLIELLD